MRTLQEAIDQRIAERAENRRQEALRLEREEAAEQEREQAAANWIRSWLAEEYDFDAAELEIEASQQFDGLFNISIIFGNGSVTLKGGVDMKHGGGFSGLRPGIDYTWIHHLDGWKNEHKSFLDAVICVLEIEELIFYEDMI